MMIANVRGVFAKFSGTVDFDPADRSKAKVEISIDATSIATPEPGRNEHLKGPDFFDAAKYPTIDFHSKSAAAAGPGAFKVTGDLSLHGVTKGITMDVNELTDEAHARILRSEFGMGFNAQIN